MAVLVFSAVLMGCTSTIVDKNLAFERVCWGDGVCHVVDKQTGKKYYALDHHQCK